MSRAIVLAAAASGARESISRAGGGGGGEHFPSFAPPLSKLKVTTGGGRRAPGDLHVRLHGAAKYGAEMGRRLCGGTPIDVIGQEFDSIYSNGGLTFRAANGNNN